MAEVPVDPRMSIASESAIKSDIEAPPVQPIVSEKEANPDLVDWDGPDDPENPFNWPSYKKWRQLMFMSVNTFLTPLASSMFTPGVSDILKEFGSSSTMMAAFLVSIYVLGYVVGPFIIAPLSELYGRVPLYHTCNALLLVFMIACAVSQNLGQLLAFRLLAGIAGVCPLTIGSGTVADMVPKEKRAGFMAIWAMGPYMGPVVGPIAGGFLVMNEGWRWVFWVLSITIAVIFIATLIFYRESYAPTLLRRKAARLRKETGNPKLRSILDDNSRPPTQIFLAAFSRPIKLLCTSPIVFLMCLFAAITYGYLYLMFTTITSIFETTYGFNQGMAGLAYLGFGIGCGLGVGIVGHVSNLIAAQASAQGRFAPECRLLPMIYGCWFIPVGLFWYGWSADQKVHWIMPIIGTGIFGFGLVAVFATCSSYLIDSYLRYAASVTAANVFLRSLFGAVLPLAGDSMYEALGLGWGNSLLAFIALAMCAVPLFFKKYGAWIRTNPRFQVKL